MSLLDVKWHNYDASVEMNESSEATSADPIVNPALYAGQVVAQAPPTLAPVFSLQSDAHAEPAVQTPASALQEAAAYSQLQSATQFGTENATRESTGGPVSVVVNPNFRQYFTTQNMVGGPYPGNVMAQSTSNSFTINPRYTTNLA